MDQEQQHTKPSEDWSEAPLDYFSDVFWTFINPWSAAVTFGLRMGHPGEKDKPKIRVRMPLQQAKALAVILLKAVRRYESEANVTVELPRKLLDSLGIAPEDWERFTKA